MKYFGFKNNWLLAIILLDLQSQKKSVADVKNVENTSTFEFQPVEKHDHALLHVDFDKNGLNNLHINRILDVASDDSDSDLFTVFEITFHP